MPRRSTLSLVMLVALLAGCSSRHSPAASPSQTTPAGSKTATVAPTASIGPPKATPSGDTVVGLVVSHTKVPGAYRVVLQPATRQSDGQYIATPGRKAVTYVIAEALVPDQGMTLIGPIKLTVQGDQVRAVTIIGG